MTVDDVITAMVAAVGIVMVINGIVRLAWLFWKMRR
jgi:hypothetical protein